MALEKQSSLGIKLQMQARNREAEFYLIPKKPVEIGAGNEALPQKTSGIENYRALKIKETLADPDQVALDASQSRMELVSDAHCLDMAVDTAESIDARNSLEKMLAHQMAACHDMAMTLISRAHEEREPEGIQKMVNSSVKLMKAFQQGLRTLQKIRTGGRQEVIVQHVNVEDGGQALVAGKIRSGENQVNRGGL